MRYNCLNIDVFEEGDFKIVPIRFEDRLDIMKWRNEQIYHLRQDKPLTIEAQNTYFESVIPKLFEQDKPNQILFSYLYKNTCIGYGGLVHINWIDKNAEISFLMNTSLEKDHFEIHWKAFLNLIEMVAFNDLKFYKIYTYAFDIRPRLYPVLISSGFKEEARLKEHYFHNNSILDVLIHSKINRNVFFRPAELTDIDLYFNWTNDEMVRSNSYSSDPIPYENHVKWFHSNINKEGYSMLIFNNVFSQSIGQVRIQKNNDKSALIGISIDAHFRGKSYSTIMISTATQYYIQKYGEIEIHAYVKLENLPSKIAFEKAGYKLIETIDFENIPSNHLIF